MVHPCSALLLAASYICSAPLQTAWHICSAPDSIVQLCSALLLKAWYTPALLCSRQHSTSALLSSRQHGTTLLCPAQGSIVHLLYYSPDRMVQPCSAMLQTAWYIWFALLHTARYNPALPSSRQYCTSALHRTAWFTTALICSVADSSILFNPLYA